MTNYGVIQYKKTDKFAIYYLCPHSGHVYLDPRFDTMDQAINYINNILHRQAKCSYCNHTVNSSAKLAFFKNRPDKQFDSFYCGCRGWD